MNYEGLVSSVNTTLWTFKLDNKITVHIGHLAAFNAEQMLPEIGERVQLYNAHYKTNKMYELEKLFLCEKSVIACSCYKTYAREETILEIIRDYGLGVSDLIEMDYNIVTVDFIKPLAQQPTEEIMLEILRCLARDQSDETKDRNNVHKCLNKSIPIFKLTTISSCQYVDLQTTEGVEGPPWSFGTHSKASKFDVLIGCLQINKRYGVVCISDIKHVMPCLITTRDKHLDKSSILNKLVLIKEYTVFTETYREAGVPNWEYILFDVVDVLVLDLDLANSPKKEIFTNKLPNNTLFIHNFEFQLCKKASVNVEGTSVIECWLEILMKKNSDSYFAYLGLNAYQVQILPFLQEGEKYQVYHNEKLRDWKRWELSRVKAHSISQKFVERTAVFVGGSTGNSNAGADPILSVTQALEKIQQSNDPVSFQGILNIKKFTPKLVSRTENNTRVVDGFGTPGSRTHTLIFVDDMREDSLTLYLNNWENLQIPLGLILDMRICVRNALPQRNKYLKSWAMTTFEVLAYEPRVHFNTVNLNRNQEHGCDKYCFLGLGNLIPCNVLIWALIVQIYIRSLKITYNCYTCGKKSTDCFCETTRLVLQTTITLFVYDEMGQAVVISKNPELLRLLLGLEPKQWRIWCEAFVNIGEYTHSFEQTTLFSPDSDNNAFCEALAVSIKIVNTTKISNLELQCRKMESSLEDNDGMPLWFCVHARKSEN